MAASDLLVEVPKVADSNMYEIQEYPARRLKIYVYVIVPMLAQNLMFGKFVTLGQLLIYSWRCGCVAARFMVSAMDGLLHQPVCGMVCSH